ncbi:MAG: right-handed parallel beta-helix repeat-containing protein [Deltaproteobacteria bacterium]|nr:right-handed parallel beta-helix repeat-containing protein [Deltaproteobacteria bacterium]
MRFASALALLLLVPCLADAQDRDLYADGSLSGDCADYDVATRSCGAGAQLGFATVGGATSAVAPGDTVWLRGGAYEERIVPSVSGRADAVVSFRGYPGEEAVIENVSDPALFVSGLSHIMFEGFTVRDCLGWGRLEDADHVVVRDMVFEGATATGTTGSLKLVRTTQSLIEGNAFVDGNDNLMVQESDRNVVVGNTFERGRHSLLSVRCSDANIFRGNSFSNPDQKAMEIYDCEGVSDAPVEYDATHRNLIEENRFILTLGSDAPHRYNGIQYAGQDGIVRRNIFYDNAGGGFNIQVYSDEALVNYGHRVYHNTLVDNRCYGIIAADDSGDTYEDNVVRNNLLFGNVGCADEANQSSIGNETAVLYSDNLEAATDPGFNDTAARDFRLTPGSPAIDVAAFLTTAEGAGSGTTMVVADARYFYDGGGVEGEVGDFIQLEGSPARARVVSVDIDARTLTLSEALDWTDGQGVALAYEGDGPDVGAFEYGATAPPGPDAGVDGGTADGGALPDGGPRDSGGAVDGGPAADPEGGCGCNLVGVSSTSHGGGAAMLLVAIAFLRRRRRRVA